MPIFLHPGVYVLEAKSPARSIEAASTSTAIFVGPTERGPLTPQRITNRTDFSRIFGGYNRLSGSGLKPTMAYAMDAFFKNGGSNSYVLRVLNGGATATAASRSVGGGGTPLVKVNATSSGTWANGTLAGGLFAIFLPSTDGASGKFRIVVVYTSLDAQPNALGQRSPAIVEDFDHLSLDPHDENYLPNTLGRSLYIRWDTGTVPAVPSTLDGPAGLDAAGILLLATPAKNTQLQGGTGGDADPAVPGDYNVAFSPGASLLDDITDASLILAPSVADDANVMAINAQIIGYAATRPHNDLFAICDLPRHSFATGSGTPQEATTSNAVSDLVADFQSAGLPKNNFAAVYWPWIKVLDPAPADPHAGSQPSIYVGPSCYCAGIYARTDNDRGVWKAPAGLEAQLFGISDLEWSVRDVHQDTLNPLGINAIRNQPAGGPVIWGARTMEPASEWRYVPVRRMAIFLRVSIYNGIQFAVFEPNDEPLWAALRLTIGGFMDRLYRQGAFAGGSPKDAYFVKCDAETTTPSDQLAGQVNVLVGFAPLRPAEFVVVTLSQIVNQKA